MADIHSYTFRIVTFIRRVPIVLACGIFWVPSLSHEALASDTSGPPKQGIQLPDTPGQQEIPVYPANQHRQDVDVLKRRRLERQSLENRQPSSSQIREMALAGESVRERPFRFFLQISLLATHTRVAPPRQHYQSDLTSHALGLYRLNKDLVVSEPQWWLGYRQAPFSGFGVYDGQPGRFGFIYSGPAVGYGALNVSRPATDEDPYQEMQGWVIHFGLSAQTRRAQVDPSGDPPEKDLNDSKGIAFDSPGLHVEAVYMNVRYGALSWNLVGGFQLGEGKIFSWFGVAAGGFY